MLLLFDTDFLVKIVGFGLFDEFLQYEQQTLAGCTRLPALTNQLKRFKKNLTGKAYRKLDELVSKIPKFVPEPKDDPWIDKMSGVDDLDIGEVQLLARLAWNKSARLATGDKRAIRQIGAVSGLSRAVSGRIITTEDAIVRLCEHHTVAYVRRKLPPVISSVDTSISDCFDVVDTQVIAKLKHEHSKLCARAGFIPPLVMNAFTAPAPSTIVAPVAARRTRPASPR